MSADFLDPEPSRADSEVWIVGVSWRAAADVMAPFTPPRRGVRAAGQTMTAALIAAAMDDANAHLPVSAAKILVIGEAAFTADLQTSAVTPGSVSSYETVAAAVLAAFAALRVDPAAACLVGAMGRPEPESGAWLLLETAARARARGAAAYAVLSAAAGDRVAIGWLELPAGETDLPCAEQRFALDAAARASALCSATRVSADEEGVRDALALVRAALALGHKVLPFVRPAESGRPTASAAPLPWIHPLPLPGHPAARIPRRAGWVAAATGGRSAALVLQEDPAAPARPDAVPFGQEICVFGADSPAALHAQTVALRQRLREAQSHDAGLELVSVAYQTTVALPRSSAYRLSVVTSSLAELDQQLHDLASALAPQTVAALLAAHRPSSGIYCGSGRRGPDAGTTAFLFPGLGASYPYMLGDLCLHFPAVREVFDSIDFVAAQLGEPTAPIQQIFPRPGAVQSQEPVTGAAVITLLMAEWALAQLLRELGIVPDALMGCSTGEFAALCQGGSIDEVAALPIIYRLSLGVARGLPAAQLGTLRSVLVAAAAESLTPLFSAAPGALYVSADLGSDCALLVGERSAVEWLLTAVEARGVAAHVLPSGVPYHTPLLSSATVSGAAELSALTVLPPKLPIWSCATGHPYPSDPATILRDASVLFVRAIALRDTVEAMYQSGVRTFLEVGPGEGLGRRVGAILRGRPHVALASNLQQRTGISQLLHLLAALHALGHPLELAPLFRRRPYAAGRHQAAPQPAAPAPQHRPSLPRPQRRASLARVGAALPALTLGLPRAERWFCLRIDRWELARFGGIDGIDGSDGSDGSDGIGGSDGIAGIAGIDRTAIYSAAELQRASTRLSEPSSLLTDWATKRAVQGLISQLTRREVALSAIELTTTPTGETRATGDWSAWLGGDPVVAAADCADAAVALVATADLGVRIGIQIAKATALPLGDAQTAVCRALFPEQPLAPSALQVVAADPGTGWIALRAPGHQALLHARAARLGAYFTTIAVIPRG